MASRIFPVRESILSVSTGFVTGLLAGIVGVGGAELRVAALLFLMVLPFREMVQANLMLSLLTSLVSFSLRASAGIFTEKALGISASMAVGSVFGAYLGSALSHRLSSRSLSIFLALILGIVSARFMLEPFTSFPGRLFTVPISLEVPLSIVFGALIGVIAGSIGVAGGEYRIPVLILVFNLSAKIGGTASQLVSLPTTITAIFKHHRIIRIGRRTQRIVITMGLGSVLGVIVGTGVLITAAEEAVRLIFGFILLLTSIQLLRRSTAPSS